MRRALHLVLLSAMLLLPTCFLPTASAATTGPGAHVTSGPGTLVVVAPDGTTVAVGVTRANLPFGLSAPLPSNVVWCYLGFPSPCSARADIPPGTTADGVWRVELIPEDSFFRVCVDGTIVLHGGKNSEGCTIPFTGTGVGVDETESFWLQINIAGWASNQLGVIECPPVGVITWLLDFDTQTTTASCGVA